MGCNPDILENIVQRAGLQPMYYINITHSKEFFENQGKHQNFDPFMLPYKFGLIFMGMKQKKKKKFRTKKIQNG